MIHLFLPLLSGGDIDIGAVLFDGVNAMSRHAWLLLMTVIELADTMVTEFGTERAIIDFNKMAQKIFLGRLKPSIMKKNTAGFNLNFAVQNIST